MPRKSYVTSMPDKTGAFLLASKVIAKHNGNIVRVSYNKAVDLHTLFIDVEAADDSLIDIQKELEDIGYLRKKIDETRVLVVDIKIPDISGAVLPVLKILDRYEINISYISSNSNNTPFQNFKMGLLIENPKIIKMLLDDISEIYQIDIIDYDDYERNLDNTIFYIRLANEMQKLLDLTTEKTMEFISESNRVLQMLQEKGENPDKVFDYIRRFAHFVSDNKGSKFKADIEKIEIGGKASLYSIQPPCGSNTYVLESYDHELMLVDTGYAIYSDELLGILNKLFPQFYDRIKSVYITHADVDHCGLLSKLKGVTIRLNQKSADSLKRQYEGIPDHREEYDFGLGYSKLSRIISGYIPVDPGNFEIIDSDTPENHENLLHIGNFKFSDLEFDVFEGSGGHVYGEMIFVCRKYGLVFTGDNIVNISGFSPERAQFNSLAPYLMGSVNVDSHKATEMRKQILNLIREISDNREPCIILGGHGPISLIKNGKLVKAAEKA
jgi:glyoxylase-like metal-dependent hydrolase (beta-lactamase superfamily II)/predicted amino acid-binding ACT domain protein